jgi:hypothetical protein
MQFIKNFLGLTPYISELDQFLTEIDHKYSTLSPSQLAEQKKYQRVYHLRDHNQAEPNAKTIMWEEF